MAHVEQLCAVLSSGVVSPQEGAFPQGLKAHIADVFMEELEKAHSEQVDIGVYRQTFNIRHTFVGNTVADHSDVVGASPVGATPTTSSFST